MYPVSEANRTAHCLERKAYDYMLRFEKSFNGFETVGNAYAFLSLCCKACDVELAHTQAEIEAMPNGAEMLSVYPENDIATYRDVLYFVAQVLGGFFCINREGKLELRKYGNTAVSSTNLRTETAEYYALETDNGLTMNLYCAPVKLAVQPDCRPPARYFLGDTTVNPGGLQYRYQPVFAVWPGRDTGAALPESLK